MEKSLDKLEQIIVWGIIVFVPLAVLPIFPNFILTPKLIFFTFLLCLLLLVKAAKIISGQKLNIYVSNFDFPVLLILISYLLSAIIKSPNKMEAFFLPGSASIVISSSIFYFLLNQLSRTNKNSFSLALIISSLFLSFTSLFAVAGILGQIPNLPSLFQKNSFTLLGDNLSVILFVGSLIPLTLGHLVFENDTVKKIFFSICLVIITLGVAGNLFNILPGKPASPKVPELNIFWSVAVDTLKESPVLGIGPGNYLTAFNRFRPLTYNQTDLFWPVRFSDASNFYLSLMTETGFLGIAGLILLLLVILRTTQDKENKEINSDWGFSITPKMLSLIFCIIALFFSGTSLPLLIVFFTLLSLNSKTNKVTLNFQTIKENTINQNSQKIALILPSLIVALPIIALVFTFSFFAVKVVSAELTYKKALDAVLNNDGVAAYNLIQKAVLQNPGVDRYHLSFSQIGFAIANSISQKPEGETISDQERTTITQLIQQSINEGKTAVSLNPTRSGNWSSLANLYRSIMAFAQGSDQFAIQTFNQAIALDPIDPNLRISLGGIFFALGDYDNAIDVFKVAVIAKPNLANARYNLAVAYREKGEINKAIAEMTNVLSLVDRNTSDYEVAKKELETLEAKKPSTEETEGDKLVPPEKAVEPVVEPPIELPEEAQPPVGPELPTEETSSTPSPTPLP